MGYRVSLLPRTGDASHYSYVAALSLDAVLTAVTGLASLGVTRSNQFPTLTGTFGVQNEQSILDRGSPTFDTAGLQLTYIVDFWGQYRRATEAARAELLGTRYARHVVETTLISDVAIAYFELREFDSQLEFSDRKSVV